MENHELIVKEFCQNIKDADNFFRAESVKDIHPAAKKLNRLDAWLHKDMWVDKHFIVTKYILDIALQKCSQKAAANKMTRIQADKTIAFEIFYTAYY